MEEGISMTVIDLKQVKKRLLKKKWMIIISTLVVGILSAIIIVLVPRYYTSQVMLAPEEEGSGAGGSLSDIASSFGIDFGAMRSSDAIYPMLYPDLFESNDFVVGLFDIEVEKLDGSVKTNYLDYLMNHQEYAPWTPAFVWVKNLFKSKPREVGSKGKKKDGVDPFMLTEREEMIVKGVKSSIKCTVDKKTNVITINVKDQDPLICATMADSVCARLQTFITQYRTSKARADYDYYAQLAEEAKVDYDEAMARYSAYCDSHKDAILQAYISQRDDLENDMGTKYNALTAINTQLQAAKARIQEKTPAFTMLQNASVPIKPEGPKRMIFVAVMMFLAFIISSFVALKSILSEEKKETPDEDVM